MSDYLFVSFLIGVVLCYASLEITTVFIVFLFDRDRFYSWLNDEFIDDGSHCMVKYNHRGYPVAYRLNMKHPKVAEQVESSRELFK